MALFRRDVLQTAEKLVAKGKIEAAVKEYKKYLSKSADDTSTLNRVGDLLVRLRKNDEAVDYYTRTAERYASDGFFVKAIAVYKKIQRIEPARSEIHLRLAELYQRQGLISDARGHYQQLADHYLRDDSAQEAIGIFERLVDLEPDNPSHRLRLADLYREQEQFREAALTYGSIASLMLSHGQVNHAFQVYERAFQVDPQNLDFIRDAVTSIRRSGGDETADQLLTTAIAINPAAESLLASDASSDPLVEDGETPRPSVAAPDDEPKEPDESQKREDPSAAEPQERDSSREEKAGEGRESAASTAATREEALEPAEWTFAPEPDLEEVELEFDLDPASEPVAARPVAGSVSEEFELIDEPAPLPRAVPPPELEPVARHSELLAEADVFLKYGLAQKAQDRLLEVLSLVPDHPGALGRLVSLHLDAGDEEAAARRATELMMLEGGDRDRAWSDVAPLLDDAGFRTTAEAVTPPAAELLEPVPPGEEGSEVGGEEGEEPVALDLDQTPADLGSVFEEVAAAAVEEVDLDLSDESAELDLEEIEAEIAPAEIAAEVEPAAEAESPSERESGAGDATTGADSTPAQAPAWLEEVESDAGDDLFEEEQEFFDLAAELQEALAEDDGAGDDAGDESERSLEEIVEGFKKGVAENIADEESDTHYNLGIAYREMMLLDEAIGEFQISARDPRFLVDSCAMLGLCFQDKGLPDLAVKWYARALDHPEMLEEQRLGLLYDLGAAYEAMEDRASAYQAYVEVYGSNSNYRDVSEKVELLKAQ